MITDVYQTAYIYISSSSKTSTALWAKGPRGTKSPIKPWSVHVIGLRIIGHNKGVYVPAHSAGSEGSLNFLLEITDRLRLAQTALRIRRLIWNQLMSEGEKKKKKNTSDIFSFAQILSHRFGDPRKPEKYRLKPLYIRASAHSRVCLITVTVRQQKVIQLLDYR